MEVTSTHNLDTPLGAFSVTVNGQKIPFVYHTQDYACMSQGPVHVFCIKVDISDLVIGDVILCSFANEGHIMQLSGYKPLPADKSKDRTYILERGSDHCRYEIINPPASDSLLTLTIGWLGHEGQDPSVFVIAV